MDTPTNIDINYHCTQTSQGTWIVTICVRKDDLFSYGGSEHANNPFGAFAVALEHAWIRLITKGAA